MKYVLILFLMPVAVLAENVTWTLNDVSIAIHGDQRFLSPQDKGALGEILPRKMFEYLKPIARTGSPFVNNPSVAPEKLTLDMFYDQIKVSAIRLDPCFIEDRTGPNVCHYQIRLVWSTTVDKDVLEAYHSFHELTETQFKQMMNEVAALNKTVKAFDVSAPLQTNLRFADANYTKKFKTIILKYIGEENLIRFNVTIQSEVNFNGSSGHSVWIFGGVEKVNGKFQKIVVARTDGANQQTLDSLFGLEDELFATTIPAMAGELSQLGLFFAGSEFTEDKAATDIYKSLTDIENPGLKTVQQIDCVSCHMAPSGKSVLRAMFPEQKDSFSDIDSKMGFKSTWPKVASTYSRSQSLKVFAFLSGFDQISGRVVNESAAVADRMNKLSGSE